MYWVSRAASAKAIAIRTTPRRAAPRRGGAGLGALALHPNEDVLDVGCGCGATKLALARAVQPHGRVTGIDVSAPMLEQAAVASREAGLAAAVRWPNEAAQGARLGRATYDAVYSGFGCMFFADPVAACANCHRATCRSGRLAFVCWQARRANPWFTVPAEGVGDEERLGALAAVRDALLPFAGADGVRVPGAAWLAFARR